MSKQQKNPNRRPDPFPAEFPADKIRKQIDSDNGALQKHEAGLAKLEKLANKGLQK